MNDVMKKTLAFLLLFVVFVTVSSGKQTVFAQTATPSATPTVALSPTPTSSASATTKGGVSTSSTTLPEELPVTGSNDTMVVMVLGGSMLVGLAAVIRVKLVENLSE